MQAGRAIILCSANRGADDFTGACDGMDLDINTVNIPYKGSPWTHGSTGSPIAGGGFYGAHVSCAATAGQVCYDSR